MARRSRLSGNVRRTKHSVERSDRKRAAFPTGSPQRANDDLAFIERVIQMAAYLR